MANLDAKALAQDAQLLEEWISFNQRLKREAAEIYL